MHSQNGTTFVPVVGWEDVGVELRCGGGHVEGLTKRMTSAEKQSLSMKSPKLDWMGESEKRGVDSKSGGPNVMAARFYG